MVAVVLCNLICPNCWSHNDNKTKDILNSMVHCSKSVSWDIKQIMDHICGLIYYYVTVIKFDFCLGEQMKEYGAHSPPVDTFHCNENSYMLEAL